MTDNSRKVWSSDADQPGPEARPAADAPTPPRRPPSRERRPPRPLRPDPPTLPARRLEVVEIAGEALHATSSPFVFSCDVSFTEAVLWTYLTVHNGTVTGRGDLAAVDIFWLEGEREQTFDRMWGRHENATKLTVTDGPRAGWVGYVRMDYAAP